MTLSYCSLSCCSSASRIRARCCRTENVPRIPQATATVSEIARISRAAIDRSLNMGIPKLRETIPETPKKRFKKPLRKTEWKAASGRGAPETERGGVQAARRWKAQRHRHRGDADAERADIEPAIAVECVEHPSAGPRPERHAEACKGRDRAEHCAHDFCAEEFAHQHGIERHHATIGEAEDHGQRIELAERTDREIGRDAQRLHEQAADQHGFCADAVGQRAERET